MRTIRFTRVQRATALLLSWALPGTSAWALTPPPLAIPAVASVADAAVDPAIAALFPPASPGFDSAPILPAAGPAAGSSPFDDDGDDDREHHPIRPILECVVEHGHRSYTAYFGFHNENDREVAIPEGSDNAFWPRRSTRPQPVSFSRGRSGFNPLSGSAAFAVDFDGSTLTWSLRGPDRRFRAATASSSSPRCVRPSTPTPTPTATPGPVATPTPTVPNPPSCPAPVMPARRYTRISGSGGPTRYRETFTRPAASSGPYTVKVVNGDALGRNRATSAEVEINDREVAEEDDFSATVTGFTRSLASLQATNEIEVKVAGAPGSTFTVEICGQGATDTTPPTVDWLAPLNGQLTADATPLARVRYADTGSAPNLTTLRILVDGVDRTALFSVRADEASVDGPLQLADGAHSLRAEIKDAAGNLGAANVSFRVDATAPSAAISSPAASAVLRTSQPQIQLSFADDGVQPTGIAPASVAISLDGGDITSALTVTAAGASGMAPAPLADGSHQIEVTVRDLAGNLSTTSSTFTIDTVAPTLTTISPAAGQAIGAPTVPIVIQYADDQALDLGTVTVRLDGALLSLLIDVDSATGTASALADGPHTLTLSVRDLAGNTGTLTVPFSTDTGRPEIAALSPPNGLPLATRTPLFDVSFADAQGIAAGSFRATINGTDRTSAFTITADGARATLAEPLPEGPNVVVVEVSDAAGNRGEARSEFLVDATAPTVAVVSPAPAAFLNTSRPMIRVTTADALSGVEPGVTRVFIDDIDVTATLAIDPDGATGSAPQELAEGLHTLRVVAADRAANPTVVESTFTIDLTPPVLDLAAPAPDGFTSDPTPEIWLRTSDAASIRVHLLSDDPMVEDLDITGLLSVTSTEARGTLVEALADGSHRLRAVARDQAGNESSITAGFVVDTVAPSLTIDSPQTGTFSSTSEPVITLLFGDERSGLNGAATSVKVDGEERAAHLAPNATGATLTLSRALGLSLADGPHRIEARVIDWAGNATDAAAIDFGVDTALPSAQVLAPPPDAFTGVAAPTLLVRVTDAAPSSGLDPLFAKLLLDGVDITTALTFTSTTAPDGVVTLEGQGVAPAALSDGLHILRLTTVDNANIPAEVISRFTVDTTAPEITPAIPEGGATVGGGAVDAGGLSIITGTLSDRDGGLRVTCSVGGVSVAGTINGSSWSCAVPVSEGVNSVTTTITDSTGHSSSSTRALTVDKTAPVVVIDMPAAGDATAAQVLTVSGHVTDATAVGVLVNGIPAVVTPGQNGGPAVFSAPNVPLGVGDSATFTATATDAAGNTGSASASVVIDRVAPVVSIMHPAAGAYLRGGVVTVDVDVVDRGPTVLEVNGIPAFDPVCSGSAPVTCRFSVSVPLVSDGVVVATAVDAAGNVGRAQVSAIIDSQAPSLVVTAPAPLFTTRETTVTVSGRLTDSSPVTLEVNGTPVTIGDDGLFEAVIAQDVLGAAFASIEGLSDAVCVARDAAGNETTTRVPVVFDRSAPVMTVATPTDGEVLLASTFTVAGTVVDATAVSVTVDGALATVGGQAWSASITGAVEGPRVLTVRAVDAAGNETVVSRVVEVDLAAPSVAITSPQAGALTRESTAVLAFTISDRSVTTVRVNGEASAEACPGGAPCARTVTVNLTEGDNAFTVEATDAGGRSASAQVSITRDSTAPALELTSSETLSRGRPATITATATDALGMERVEVRMGGVVMCSGVASCTASILPPDGARAGDALNITALATDRAGNSVTRSRSLRVTSEGVVTGTVLDDATSLPLAGATVTLMGATPRSVTTDATGRYNLAVDDSSATVRITKAGHTTVDRLVSVVSGTGAAPLDARLTRVAESGVTPLSAQALPNLLPLGYSPLLALHRAAADTTAIAVALPSAVTALPQGTMLVRYDAEMRDWRVVAPGLAASSSVLPLDVSGAGTFAVIAPDDAEAPALAGLAAGAPLPALREITPISATATSTGRVDPAVLPPTGGTATGHLRIDSPETLPSGTVVQADVDETYLLSTGEESGAPKRSMDIQAFRYAGMGLTFGAAGNTSAATATLAAESLTCTPAATDAFALCARFPITPSRTWPNGALREGRVHLDLLAGRENARGVAGGSEAVSVVSGSVRLNVAAGSLPEDTAVSLVSHATFSSFLPNGGGVTPLAEVTADFATAVLGSSASLVFSGLGAGVAPDDSLLVARIDRGETDGIPRLQVVARGEVRGADVVSVADAGLAGVAALEGITRTSRYVLFRVTGAVAWVTGHTMARTSGSGDLTPVRAVVSISGGWPFATAASAAGVFALPVTPGSVTLSARVPGQSLAGTAAVVATTGQAVDATVMLEGTVSAATITPASGAVGVEVNGFLTLTSPVALDAASVNATNIQLRAAPSSAGSPSTPVALRFVLSGSGRTLSIIPTSALAFSTSYTLEVASLVDTTGGLVTAPVTTFRTKDDVKPVYNLRALTFSFPDADGLVTVGAPAGTFPPGTEILIINGGNGYVVSLTAGNDGGASAQFPATTSDRLFITVTDPFGNSTSYQQSRFVNPVTGEIAIGPAGGIVEGPGGTALEVPDGALSTGATFKLIPVTAAELEQEFPGQRPDLGVDADGNPAGHVASGLKIERSGQETFDKEIDVAFPVPPDAPANARFSVFRRLTVGDQGGYVFEVIDTASVSCPLDATTCGASEKRVRTQSKPFSGWRNAMTAWVSGGETVVGSVVLLFLTWDVPPISGVPDHMGVVTGRILQPVREAGEVRYDAVVGALVSAKDASGQSFFDKTLGQGQTVAISQTPDGRYTLFDRFFSGGAVTVDAKKGEEKGTGTGFEVPAEDYALLRKFTNRVSVNVNFPIATPPPTPPAVAIEICEVTGTGCVPRSGLALVGRRLRLRASVAKESGDDVTEAEVNGASLSVESAEASGGRQWWNLKVPGAQGVSSDFTPTAPGSVVIRVLAKNPSGETRFETETLRVIGSSGSVTRLPDEPPAVISRKTNPPDGSVNVRVAGLTPEVYFSEPVVNLVAGGTVQLDQVGGDDPGPVEFDLIGVSAGADDVPAIVGSVSATTRMSSITLRPRVGLKLGTTYRLTLAAGIVDTDTPPKPLPPLTVTFSTFTPNESGPADGGSGSPGIGMVGDRAFVVRNNFYNGHVSVWDVSDPLSATNLTETPAVVAPRPVDVSADPAGMPVAAVAVMSTNVSRPSSVIFVDGADPKEPRFAGAVTVAGSAQEGFISRTAFYKDFVYTATTKKGIQVIDVNQGLNTPDFATMLRARTEINTDGRGFGQEAVVGTIPYPALQGGGLVHMTDIAATEIQTNPLVAATGTLPLLLADPLQSAVASSWQPRQKSVEMVWQDAPFQAAIVRGNAIALGAVGARDLAVVAVIVDGPEGAEDRLIAVDVRHPLDPVLLGSVALRPLGVPQDIVLRGTTAIVTTQKGDGDGEAIIVELTDPTKPYIKGRIAGAGGRAAITSQGDVVTTANALFGSTVTKMGGLHTLSLEGTCPGLGKLDSAKVVQYFVYDAETNRTEAESASLGLTLCQNSKVTVASGDSAFTIDVDGSGSPKQDIPLSAGLHRLGFRDLLTKPEDKKTVDVTVTSVIDDQSITFHATIKGEVRNRPVLQVARTLVKGVDLFDGHLALQATDLSVRGRHLSLDVSRSYTSAGLGATGGGWSWGYQSQIARAGAYYTVETLDGSRQVFKRTGDSFTPQRGYHSKLELGPDGALLFTDKAANVYKYTAWSSDEQEQGPWFLRQMTEPHGDRLWLEYDRHRRVLRVEERHGTEETAAHALKFKYAPFREPTPGEPRDPADEAIESVTSEGPDEESDRSVKYEYTPSGELHKVIRSGRNVDGGPPAEDQPWTYVYAPADGKRDQGRLELVTDPDGNTTRYAWASRPFSPSEGDLTDRSEYVETVTEAPGHGMSDAVTTFTWEQRSADSTEIKTTVTDARSHETRYTMAPHGGVTLIEAPLDRTSVITWKTNDGLKESETLPGGVRKDYGYDANGNLTLEKTTGADGTFGERRWEYDLKFNRVKTFTDEEAKVTSWDLDGITGDPKSMTNAVGDTTVYAYEGGLLHSETDARGVLTIYSNDDAVGMWKTRTTAPYKGGAAIVATRHIDARGRIRSETDGLGASTERTFDGFDRVVSETRHAAIGGNVDPGAETIVTRYTRAGRPRTVRNALSGVTTNDYDGMGRLIATTTPVSGGRQPQTLTTAILYDGNGNVERSTDARGVVKQFVYDELDRLTEVSIVSGPGGGPTGVVAKSTYEGATDTKATETDLAGNVTKFFYDGLWRLVRRESPVAGYVERLGYDRKGNVTSATGANGIVTKTDYDGLGRVTKTTFDFGGASESFVETKYESTGPISHMFRTEDYDSRTKLRTLYAHDAVGREVARVQVLEGDGSAQAVASAAGNVADEGVNSEAASLIGSVPAGQAAYRWLSSYGIAPLPTGGNAMKRVVKEPSIARGAASPRTTTIFTDGLGREVARQRGALPATRIVWDNTARTKTETDENGNATVSTFDTAGRLVKVMDADGKTSEYAEDGGGNRTFASDRRGVVRTQTFDNLGRPLVASIAGSLTGNPWSETHVYLDAQHEVHVTDARNALTVTTLDGLNRPTEVRQFATQADGTDRVKVITYDGADKDTETDWLGHVTRFAYDRLHRLVRVTDPVPFANQFEETFYDDAHNRVRVKDRRGHFTVTQKDSLGRVVWVRRGACAEDGAETATCETVERNEYDGSGNRVLTADGLGHKTRFGYDAASRLVEREEGFEAASPASETTLIRFELDAGGRVKKEFHGRLAATEPTVSREFDKVNRVETETNAENETTTYGYDGEGNRTSVKPPGQPATTYAYDELGKLVSVTMPPTEDYASPAVTRFGYDRNRNKNSQTDARGHETTYGYDRANRMTRMTEPGNLVTDTVYDANGGVLVLTDANRATATSLYDELGRKKSTTYAASTSAPSTAWREVVSESFEYDENGNPLKVHRFVAGGTDPPQDRPIVRTFDAQGRVKTETTTLPDGGTRTVGYEYHPNGTRKAMTDPAGRRTAYEYDAQNRLKRMVTNTDPGGMTSSEGTLGVTTYAYYADDLMKEVVSPNGVRATSTYDKAGRLKALTNADAFHQVSRYEYEYGDGRGNRTKQVETNGGVAETTQYAYDVANRLKAVAYPADAPYPAGRLVTYTYDKAGNREGEQESAPVAGGTGGMPTAGEVIVTRTGVFDANNRLTDLTSIAGPRFTGAATGDAGAGGTGAGTGDAGAGGTGVGGAGTGDAGAGGTGAPPIVIASGSAVPVPRSNLSIQYDRNGNETTRTLATYATAEPQPGESPTSETTTVSTYDLTDHLVEQTRDGSSLARHEYDAEGRRTKKIGEDGIRQYVYDDTSILSEYSTTGTELAKYDYGAERVIRQTGFGEGTRYFTYDGLGTPTALLSPTGDVATRYHLDAWGNYRSTSELTTSHNRFGYTGHYWDNEAGLYYAKARFYDPQTARFTQADSFLGNVDDPPSLHRYFYANANPIRFVDPTGYAADGENFWGWFLFYLSSGLAEAPNHILEGVSAGLTPGEGREDGHVLRKQNALLEVASNEKLDPLTRGLATLEASQLQPAAMFEEGLVRPLEEAPEDWRVVSTESRRFYQAEEPLQRGEAALRATASGAKLFGTILSAFSFSSSLRRSPLPGRAVVPAAGEYLAAPGRPPVLDGPPIEPVSVPMLVEERHLALPAPPVRSRRTLDWAIEHRLPNPPPPSLTSRIGTSSRQAAELQADIRRAIAERATDIRVNQQQVNASGVRVGINRPDLQYTRRDGTRVYIEYDPANSAGVNSDRGRPHLERILANDPTGVVILKTIK